MNQQRAHLFAASLDHLEGEDTEALGEYVRRNGTCTWLPTTTDGPQWTGDDDADREIAAAYCAGCPVAAECTEVEFRTTGAATSSVWGLLPPDRRRAAYLAWLDRRDGGGRQ